MYRDVKFALIGFGGPNQKWVHHYTTDGKIEFTGKIKNIDFEKEPETKRKEGYEAKLEAFVDQFNVEIGKNSIFGIQILLLLIVTITT